MHSDRTDVSIPVVIAIPFSIPPPVFNAPSIRVPIAPTIALPLAGIVTESHHQRKQF
jgi:hypothetical protein